MLQVQRRIKNVEILINYKGSRERVRGGGVRNPPSLLAYQTRRLFETKILTSALFNWLIFSMKRALHFATKLNYTVKRGSVSNIRLLPRAKMLFVPTIFFSLAGRLCSRKERYFRNFLVGMCRWDPGTLKLYQS